VTDSNIDYWHLRCRGCGSGAFEKYFHDKDDCKTLYRDTCKCSEGVWDGWWTVVSRGALVIWNERETQ